MQLATASIFWCVRPPVQPSICPTSPARSHLNDLILVESYCTAPWYHYQSVCRLFNPSRYPPSIVSSISCQIVSQFLIATSSDASGYSAALLVGFPLTYANLGFFCSLLTFFLVGSKATKFKSSVKKTFEADHKEGEGQRNWVQVLCNGGIPAQLAVLYLLVDGPKECSLDFRSGN